MNLHEELGRIGADATAGSRGRLASAEVADGLGARVRRGRRSRVLGGAGVVAGVALVAVGVWSWVPFGGAASVGPAGTLPPTPAVGSPEADPYLYQVDGTTPVDTSAPFSLAGDSAVVCGDVIDVEAGGYSLSSAMPDGGVFLLARLHAAESAGTTAEWEVSVGGGASSITATAVAMVGDVVVGVGSSTSGHSVSDGWSTGSSLSAPEPTRCGGASDDIEFNGATDVRDVVLVEAWGTTGESARTRLAVLAADSTEPSNYVEEGPLTTPSTDAVPQGAVDNGAQPVDTSDLRCGAEGRLEEGATWYDKGATDADVAAVSQTLADDESVVEQPSTLWVGYEAHRFVVTVEADAGLTYAAYPMLFRGDEIVGRLDPVGIDGVQAVVYTPQPGDCGAFGDWVSGNDDTFTPKVLIEGTFADGTVGAQFVVSAGDIEYTGLGQWEGGVRELDIEDLATAEVVTLLGGFTCEATLDAAEATADDGVGDTSTGAFAPIPSTVETGRLYGYGDDALVGGYPAPLGPDATFAVEEFGREPARLVLSSGEDRWVFDAAWSERDDLPHDDAGWFVALSQVWDCGSPDLIPEGDYEARLIYSDADGDQAGTAVLSDIAVVEGVPSLPEIDSAG
ncbi:hypothetical protein [Demequina sp. NBRC 110051]|uniref:hypothetical protein n=1 Tax=Demequina sp. NBRC 110051 TaxID=1570340 RepID=UPI00117C52C8|nr:hypothetical protein [Demequina sp. NBRC 110051]